MESINLADMLIWYVVFMLSFTAHEAAHAFAAMKGGDFTAYHGGQATLNPIPHIQRSPFGTIVVPLISYVMMGWMIGWASAPYDPEWAKKYPRRAAWMAAAGPAANLIILMLAFVGLKVGLSMGVLMPPNLQAFDFTAIAVGEGLWVGVAKMLSLLFILNMLLFVFNLFPVPPLDGSGVITLFMSPTLARKYNTFINQPMYALLGILIAWRLVGAVFWKILRVIIRLLYPDLLM